MFIHLLIHFYLFLLLRYLYGYHFEKYDANKQIDM